MLNENKVYIYTSSIVGMRTRRSTDPAFLIFGWVLACAGSGVNKVTDDCGADINSKLTLKKRDKSVKYLTLCSSSEILTPDAHTVMSSGAADINSKLNLKKQYKSVK